MDSTDSEKDLKVNPDELLEKCSDWTMSVNSTGLSSMNVGSTFSSFISCGVGTNFFSSLNTAIKKVDSIAYNLATSINKAITEQIEAENNSALTALDTMYGVDLNSGVNSLDGTDTGSYDVDNSNNNLDINEIDNTQNVELDDSDKNELDVLLKSMKGENTSLITEDSDSAISKEVLESLNLTDRVDEEILSIAEEQIEAVLLEALESNSKAQTSLTESLYEIGKDLIDSSDSIKKVYEYLSKSNNSQKELKNIYLENYSNSDIDEDAVSFTKYFVDTLAIDNNIGYKDLLTDTKYQPLITEHINELLSNINTGEEYNG